jgi:pimeloyl-ACP methyl ester carboxylesterase
MKATARHDDRGTPVAALRAIHERVGGSQLVGLKPASHLSNIEQPEALPVKPLTGRVVRL